MRTCVYFSDDSIQSGVQHCWFTIAISTLQVVLEQNPRTRGAISSAENRMWATLWFECFFLSWGESSWPEWWLVGGYGWLVGWLTDEMMMEHPWTTLLLSSPQTDPTGRDEKIIIKSRIVAIAHYVITYSRSAFYAIVLERQSFVSSDFKNESQNKFLSNCIWIGDRN